MANEKKSNAPIWIGVGIIVAAIIGVGIYLSSTCGNNCDFFAFTKGSKDLPTFEQAPKIEGAVEKEEDIKVMRQYDPNLYIIPEDSITPEFKQQLGLDDDENISDHISVTLDTGELGPIPGGEDTIQVQKLDSYLMSEIKPQEKTLLEYIGVNINPCNNKAFNNITLKIGDGNNVTYEDISQAIIDAQNQSKTIICLEGNDAYYSGFALPQGMHIIGMGDNISISKFNTVGDEIILNGNNSLQNVGLFDTKITLNSGQFRQTQHPDKSVILNGVSMSIKEDDRIFVEKMNELIIQDSLFEIKISGTYDQSKDLTPIVQVNNDMNMTILNGNRLEPTNSNYDFDGISFFGANNINLDVGSVELMNNYSKYPLTGPGSHGLHIAHNNIISMDRRPKSIFALGNDEKFYNNSIYILNNQVPATSGKGILENIQNSSGAEVYNNIFMVGNNSANAKLNVIADTDPNPATNYHNNLTFQVDSCCFDTASATGNITGQNPNYMNPTNDEFMLKPNSPAIGMGVGGEDMGAFALPDPFNNLLVP